jgi:polyisoprenoid-binding protein YceI
MTIRLIRSAAKRIALLAAGLCVLASAQPLAAQQAVVTLDSANTTIDITLGATMHTVHGVFKLKNGQIRLDPSTGVASGAIIVDATSGDTGNSSRDKKMHGEILESAKFPEITFIPNHANVHTGAPSSAQTSQQTGTQLQALLAQHSAFQVDVSGTLRLHGGGHPTTLLISVQPTSANQLQLSTQFTIPYIEWGLKNPSSFILRVGDTVDIDIHTTAALALGSIAQHD